MGLICPLGFKVNDLGNGCVPDEYQCKDGFEINEERTACVPAPGSIVPFPFLFTAFCCGILVCASYIKSKENTKVLSTLICFIGSLEMILYFVMFIQSFLFEEWLVFALIILAMILQIFADIYFYVMFHREIS